MNTNIDTHCEGAARPWHAIKGQTYIFILDFVALLFNSSFKHPNLSKQENPLLKSLMMVELGKGSAQLTGMQQSSQASVSFLLFLLWWVNKLSALTRVSTLVKFRTTSYDEWSKWCLSLWTFCPCAVVSVLRNTRNAYLCWLIWSMICPWCTLPLIVSK